MKAALRTLLESKLALALVFLVLIALATYYEYPGWTSNDSEFQYKQVLSGHYTDWQPPIMVVLWSICDKILPGRAGIFLFQIGLYWLGLAAIVMRLADRGHHLPAWGVMAIAVLPTNLLTVLVIQKDAGMAGCLIAAFALAFLVGETRAPIRWVALSVAGLLLAYATLVRTNGVFATPAALMFAVNPRIVRTPVKLVLIYVATAAALVPISSFLNDKVMSAEKSEAIRSLQIFDIAGIAVRSNDFSMFPSPAIAAVSVPNCYTPVFWDPLGKPPCAVLPARPVTQVWLRTIASHPFAYLGHRASFFVSALTARVLRHHAADLKYNNKYFLNSKPTSTRALLLDEALGLSLFTPVFALAAGLVAILLSYPGAVCGRSEERLAFFLSLSGLVYGFAYCAIGVATDTRYFFWSALAGDVALVIALAARFDLFRARSRTGVACMLFLILVAGATEAFLLHREWTMPQGDLMDRGTGLVITAAVP